MRANKGKKQNCVATGLIARNCIVMVRGRKRTEIAMKQLQSQYNFKIRRKIENGLSFFQRGQALHRYKQSTNR